MISVTTFRYSMKSVKDQRDKVKKMNRHQIKGKACERKKEVKLRRQCSNLKKLKKGADFRCRMPDGTLRLIEVKSGKSSLTKYQRQVRDKARARGIKYEVQRCK